MENTDGESSGGGGRPCPPLLNKQGLTGPGTESIAVLPNELAAVQSFIAEVVASGLAATSAGPPPPLPAWKVSMIRAVGNVLLTMMAGSVAFADVTHPSQHNNMDGGHKTVQAQASGRREDGGGVLTDGQSLQTATGSLQTATGGGGHQGNMPKADLEKSPQERPKGAVRADGIGHQSPVDQFLAVEQLAGLTASMEDVKGMLAQLCAGVAGMAMGPPAAVKANRQPVGRDKADLKPERPRVLPDRAKATGNVFCRAGSHWDVTFDGGRTIHLRHTLGVEYLSYLLHRPGQSMRAFDLELAINPDKGQARDPNSIQKTVDPQTKREARKELQELQSELEEAEAQGLVAKVKRLQGEIAKLEAVVGSTRLLDADTGERARNNVRKAIDKVVKNLRKGGSAEQALAQHITQFVSLGYNIAYNPPEGCRWA